MISTDELVDWTKAIPDTEDALLRSLERAAVAYVNEPGGRYFGARTTITETLRWRGGVVLLGNEVVLGDSEVFTVEEWDGTVWGSLDATRYLLSGRLLHLTGTPAAGGRHVRVTYPAGYVPGDPEADPPGDPDVWDAPEDIKQAVRMLVGHWYVNRGDTSEEVAESVNNILAKYR